MSKLFDLAIEKEYVCVISGLIMVNPSTIRVAEENLALAGPSQDHSQIQISQEQRNNSFETNDIHAWLTIKNIHPKTDRPLYSQDLIPCPLLQNEIETFVRTFVQEHPDDLESIDDAKMYIDSLSKHKQSNQQPLYVAQSVRSIQVVQPTAQPKSTGYAQPQIHPQNEVPSVAVTQEQLGLSFRPQTVRSDNNPIHGGLSREQLFALLNEYLTSKKPKKQLSSDRSEVELYLNWKNPILNYIIKRHDNLFLNYRDETKMLMNSFILKRNSCI